MARKFKTSDIIDPVKAPLTKRSLEHINSSFNELSEDIVKSLIGTYTSGDVVILNGCEVTITSGSIPGTGTATLSAGAIYYNGRIYKVDANSSLATTAPQTLVWQIEESTIVGDPAIFSDGLTYDFHIIEKFKLIAGTSGSGIANYNDANVRYLFASSKGNKSLTSFSITNATFGGCAYNFIKNGKVANIVLDVAMTIINGSLPSGVVLNKIPGLDILPNSDTTSSIVGTINIYNTTALSNAVYKMMRHNLEPPDAGIDANGRISIDTRDTASSGQSILVTIQATLLCE